MVGLSRPTRPLLVVGGRVGVLLDPEKEVVVGRAPQAAQALGGVVGWLVMVAGAMSGINDACLWQKALDLVRAMRVMDFCSASCRASCLGVLGSRTTNFLCLV